MAIAQSATYDNGECRDDSGNNAQWKGNQELVDSITAISGVAPKRMGMTPPNPFDT